MLPKLTIPEYSTTLPISKKKVKFRPFLTGEKKILLIAKDTGDDADIEAATIRIIDICTYQKLDIESLPFTDIEWIFIKIIEKSISEVVPLNVKCGSCNKDNDYDLDLSKTELTSGKDSKIMLEDNLGIIMKYPSISQVQKLKDNNSPETVFNLIIDCVQTIFTDKTEYQSKDSSREDIIKWVDQLNDTQFSKIEEFMVELPALRNKIEFNCIHCKEKNLFYIEGLKDVF